MITRLDVESRRGAARLPTGRPLGPLRERALALGRHIRRMLLQALPQRASPTHPLAELRHLPLTGLAEILDVLLGRLNTGLAGG